MQVADLAAGIRPGVDSNPVATLHDTLCSGDAGRRMQQLPRYLQMPGLHRRQRVNVLARDNENMRWRTRADVSEREQIIVLVDELCGNFMGNNSTKDTGIGQASAPSG